MTDQHVIDIRRYLERAARDRSPGVFAVWGGGGERSRLALPVWRAIYLSRGDWGGIVSTPRADPTASPRPFFVLDLRADPARLEWAPESLVRLPAEAAPSVIRVSSKGLCVFLGESQESLWYLQVRGTEDLTVPEGRDRETLLFLAGECAGLLFFRDLSTPFPSSSSTP